MSYSRDPHIKYYTPEKLRWFAQRFSEMASDHRKQASDLDAKANRYLARASKLEREE